VLSVYWDGNVIWDNTEGRYHCTEMARHKLQRIKMNHEDFVLFIITQSYQNSRQQWRKTSI